jgi:DNA replication protein DnaC
MTAARKKSPKFRSTPEFERLEAQVAAMRDSDRKKGLPAKHDPTGPTPPHIGGRLEELMAKFHVTPEVREQLDAEAERADAAERENLRRTRLLGRWRSMCPEKFRETFDPALVEADVDRAEIAAVTGWQYGPEGLFIVGESGRSKTWAMHAMLQRVIVDEARSAVVMDGIRFANECVAAFRDSDTTEKWLEGLTRPDVLAIDDVAKRFTPATAEGFFAVMDRRSSRLKPVILTSNFTGTDMKEKIGDDRGLGDPLVRRIKQHCRVVVF